MARIMPSARLPRVTGCPDSGGPAARSAPIWPGSNHQLGSTWTEESTNFAVWAPEANAAYLCLVDEDGTETRHRLTERSLGIWHGAVPGIRPGQRYGYRVAGPWAPQQGLRFNTQKLLLDPYARAVSGELVQDPAIFGYTVGRPGVARLPRLRRQGAAQRGRRRPVRLGRRPPCSGAAGATPSSTSCTSRG